MDSSSPAKTLSVMDGMAITVGIVVGAGIFKTPGLVAAQAGNPTTALILWLAGGAVSLIGALCYAELASAYPSTGGDYYFLKRAMGGSVALLFAWTRVTVIQTGSIAMLAFLIGDYAGPVFGLKGCENLFALISIPVLTGLNVLGIGKGKWVQRIFTAAVALGLAFVFLAGIIQTQHRIPVLEKPVFSTPSSLGKAMIFVLLTYGGWNEAAYLSAEIKGTSRSVVRVLVSSIGVITVMYFGVNYIFLNGLGITSMTASGAVASDLMKKILGQPGAKFVSLLIVIAGISTMNGVILTGARTSYSLGKDLKLFLGRWRQREGNPVNALLLQAGLAILLVFFGMGTRSGFETMVEYTAPVFWFFFLLVGLSVFVLRRKDGAIDRPFSVPFYPFLPALFCMVCLYMLRSSLAYTGKGALLGVAALFLGIPLILLQRKIQSSSD